MDGDDRLAAGAVKSIIRGMNATTPWRMGGLIGACLIIMAALDFSTGQELAFSCAYLLPVSLTAWWFSRRAMVAVSFVSCVMAFVVDELDGYAYSHPGIQYWNASTCFIISIATGLVLSRLKAVLIERQQANDELRAALEKLEASTQEIRKLQSGLQVVCAWTKRIKVGDEWMTAEDFLVSQLHLKLSHGMSPEALQEWTKGLDLEPESESRIA